MADNVIVRVPEQQFIKGEDGYSPEVTIENIEHGHSVTITDRDHPEGQSFNVMDGDSAYEQAVAGGYTGTEAQFNEELQSFKELSEQAADSANTAAGAAFRAQNYERHAGDAEVAARAYADIALIRMNSADTSAQAAAETATTFTEQTVPAAVNTINKAKADALTAVGNAQTTAVGAVQQESTTQQAAIQQKGDDVLESIPSDYTELSEDVAYLKGTNEVKTNILAVNGAVVQPFDIAGTGYVRYTDGTTPSSSKSSYTNYIDVSMYASVLYKRQKSTTVNSDSGIAFYDENKNYLSGVQLACGESSAGYQDALYEANVPFGAVYARFSTYTDTNTYGYFELYGKSILYKESQFYQAIPNVYPGYYTTSGAISAQTSDKELYTEKLPCFSGLTYLFGLRYRTSTHAMVIMVNEWTDRGVFRRTIVESRTLKAVSYVYTPDSNISEVSFAFRTYDDADYIIKTNCDLLSLYNTVIKYANSRSNIIYPFSDHINKGINHRGFNTVAPEETLPAYQLSVENGFKFVECDVRFTSDGVPVLLHDATVDRTSNGTGNIADMTFAQARELDFGSWKSETYAGTKIMSFEEFIIFCKTTAINPYVEIEVYHLSASNIRLLNDITKKYGMEKCVTWLASDIQNLQRMIKENPSARCGFVIFNQPTAEKINAIDTLYTGLNEVFLDCDINYVGDALTLAKTVNIPLELWIVDNQNTIESLDDYVSGVTSDNLNFETIKKNQALSS